MTKKISICCVLLLISLQGCSSVKLIDNPTFSDVSKRESGVSDPDIVAHTTARVGEVMASYQPAYQSVLESYSQTLSVAGSSGEGNIKFTKVLVTSDTAEYVQEARNSRYLFYKSPTGINVNSAKRYGGVVASATEPNTVIGLYWSTSSNPRQRTSQFYFVPTPEPVKGDRQEKVIINNGPRPFVGVRREFIYNGISNGTIHFIYKEFTSDGMARPAFTTLIDLDYKPGKKFVYQHLEFTVSQADATEIQYIVAQNFQ